MRYRRRRSRSQKGIQNQISGLCRDVQNTLDQTFRFGGVEYIRMKNILALD